MKKFWNWVRNEDGTRILTIDGVIAEESWFDDDVTPKLFREQLNAGTGDIVTWVTNQNCTNTHKAFRVAGRFYMGVYSPDRFALTVRPVSGRAKVANCASSEDDLTDNSQNPLGFADFGTGIGYNPCLNIVPTVGTTWTGLKTLYTK